MGKMRRRYSAGRRRRYRVSGRLRMYKRRAIVRRYPGLLTLSQAERYAGVTRQSIHNWRRQGILEVVRRDSEVFVVRKSLARLLAVRKRIRTLRSSLSL